jgi:peptidoglycan/LPS O-acetylase OafA/YrhL
MFAPSTSTPSISARPRHVSGLALLRGIAALSVGLYHFTGAVLPKLHISGIESLFKNGWLGVDIFFVISGFIIPYSLLGKNYSPRKFWPYMSRRIIRINPPAYIAMLLVLVQWYSIDYLIVHRVNYTKDVSLQQIAHNLLFTVPFSNYNWIIGIFWTLAIEFQFYIFIGILFNILFERKSIICFVGIFLAVGLIQYLPFSSTNNFFHFSPLFALGGVVLYRQCNSLSIPLYIGLLVLFTGLAYVETGLYEAITGLATALAIQYVNIENGFTKFIGNISYSFYLVHVLIGTTCEFVLSKLLSTGPVFNRLVLQGVCVMAAIVGAYIFYLLIEQPFMRLASRIKT